MAAADGIITGFNTKYTYNFRAIRAADTDGNPDTVADPTWTPLVVTPRFPDYTSNDTIYSAAAAKVLASLFHRDHFDFSIVSSTARSLKRR